MCGKPFLWIQGFPHPSTGNLGYTMRLTEAKKTARASFIMREALCIQKRHRETDATDCQKSPQTFWGMHEGAAAPSFLIVSTGFAGRAGRFFGASAQKNHFRSLAMQDEWLHPAWSVSKTQFLDTQRHRETDATAVQYKKGAGITDTLL